MVYYVEEELANDWSVVVHLKPRDLYDMGDDIGDGICENEPYTHQELERFFEYDIENMQLTREEDDKEPPHVEYVQNDIANFAEMSE